MHINLTRLLYDINKNRLSTISLKVKKRMGNFKQTAGKKIKKIEHFSKEKLMFVEKVDSRDNTFLDVRVLPYFCQYLEKGEGENGIELTAKILFDKELLSEYIKPVSEDNTDKEIEE